MLQLERPGGLLALSLGLMFCCFLSGKNAYQNSTLTDISKYVQDVEGRCCACRRALSASLTLLMPAKGVPAVALPRGSCLQGTKFSYFSEGK